MLSMQSSCLGSVQSTMEALCGIFGSTDILTESEFAFVVEKSNVPQTNATTILFIEICYAAVTLKVNRFHLFGSPQVKNRRFNSRRGHNYLKLTKNNCALTNNKYAIFRITLYRFGKNSSFDIATKCNQFIWSRRMRNVGNILFNDWALI